MNYLLSPDFKSHLENAYYIAGVVLALGLAISMFQLYLFRHDSKIRNERSAAEKAIEYSSRYLSRYVELDSAYVAELQAKNLPFYEGKVMEFHRSALPSDLPKVALQRFGCASVLPGLNELLTISAAFTSGVACEKVGFEIIGRTFCGAVASRYDVLCIARSNSACDYFQPIVQLYKTWSPRLSAAELSKARSDLDQQISALGTPSIPSIGSV
jgi:hypothetical protein